MKKIIWSLGLLGMVGFATPVAQAEIVNLQNARLQRAPFQNPCLPNSIFYSSIQKPDLTVFLEDIDIVADPTGGPRDVIITVSVSNIGPYPYTLGACKQESDVTATFNDASSYTGEELEPPIAVGGQATVTWDPRLPGTGNNPPDPIVVVHFHVDPNYNVAETNETNNDLTVCYYTATETVFAWGSPECNEAVLDAIELEENDN